MRQVETGVEISGWVCGGIFVVAFVGGGMVALAKNLRAPTARSKRWGKTSGVVNLLFGVLFVASAVADPPHHIVIETVAEPEEIVRVGAQVATVETISVERDIELPGGIHWLALLQLVGFGLSFGVFGGVSLWASRRSLPPE